MPSPFSSPGSDDVERKSRPPPLHQRHLLPTPAQSQPGSSSSSQFLQRLSSEHEELEELMYQLQAHGLKIKELLQAGIREMMHVPRPSSASSSKGEAAWSRGRVGLAPQACTPVNSDFAVARSPKDVLHDLDEGTQEQVNMEDRDPELDGEVIQEHRPSLGFHTGHVTPLPSSMSGAALHQATSSAAARSFQLSDGRLGAMKTSRSRPQLLAAWFEHDVEAFISSHPSFRETSADVFPSSSQSGRKVAARLTRARTGDVRIETESRFQWLVVRPSSHKRVFWDIMSTLVVLYDLFIIPFEAFTPPITLFTVVADWTTTIFWIVDMAMSCLTGYYEEGVVEMRPPKIIHRYLHSWFGVDVLAVCGDIVILVLGSSVSAGSVLRFSKTARLVRVLRFLRLARLKKLHKALTELLDKVKSEYFRVILQICFLMLTLVILNHYIACGWYAIGDSDWFNDPTTWLNLHDTNEGGTAYWYMTSLHWSLTQFTPASMEVYATNTQERVFSVLVLLFALVAFSSFLSSITASMTYLRQLQQDALQQEAALRKYFLQNEISAELGQCILKYCNFQRTSKVRRRFHESEMPILATLPEHIMVRVHEELYVPDLEKHPFFEQYGHLCHSGMAEICHRAVSLKHVSAGQTIFIEGELASCMYFVTRHAMDYHYTAGHSQKHTQIEAGDWLSESALWMSWNHCGRLLGKDATECVEVHADACRKVLLADYHAKARDSVVTYARLYAELILSGDDESFTDLSSSAFTLETLANAMRECGGRRASETEWSSEASPGYGSGGKASSKERRPSSKKVLWKL